MMPSETEEVYLCVFVKPGLQSFRLSVVTAAAGQRSTNCRPSGLELMSGLVVFMYAAANAVSVCVCKCDECV